LLKLPRIHFVCALGFCCLHFNVCTVHGHSTSARLHGVVVSLTTPSCRCSSMRLRFHEWRLQTSSSRAASQIKPGDKLTIFRPSRFERLSYGSLSVMNGSGGLPPCVTVICSRRELTAVALTV